MIALVRLLCAVALAVAALVPRSYAQPGAAAVPQLRLPRNVEPLDYDVHLRVNPAEAPFTGSVDIRLRVLEPTDLVWLNAKGVGVRDASAVAAGGDAIAATVVPGSEDVIGVSFAKVLPAGEVKLSLRFSATMDGQGSVGLFRQDENGRWYALTQLEPMDARRVLPCFDEPDRKATWKLVLTIPGHMRAFANMPVESERAGDTGWREVTFQRSPPLPSYLVAFAVGEFDVVDGGRAGVNATPVSIIVPKGRSREAQDAAANTGAVLAAAERFFGVPYPFPKLDLLAYPKSFFGAAMENPGLITYGARYLLARPDEAGPLWEQRFLGITTHEIAHMWFGDYVTPAWWNDLWLNESFASWLGSKLVMEMRPQWPRSRRSNQRTHAIDADQLPAARALRQSIDNARDVRAAFDGITYSKGETLLAMFEQWLGPDRFRDGVRAYVTKHAWSNATTDDFFAALAANDPAIAAAFRAFADRPGVPLLDVALNCKGSPALEIAQQRFVPVGVTAEPGEPWTFPACFDFGTASASRQVCTIVREPRQTVPLGGACPQWVVANRNGIGYYLPRLSPALYDALAKADRILVGADYDPLLGDLGVLARGGAVRYDVALRVAAREAGSPDLRVARRAYALAGAVPAALVDPANKARYAAFIRRDFGDRARKLGWLPQKGDGADVLRLRLDAVALVAIRGEDTALARKGQQLAQRWLVHRSAIPPEARRVVLVGAARTSSGKDAAALFNALQDIALSTKDPNEREDAYRALGAFPDPVLMDRGLAHMLAGDARSRFASAALEEALDNDATRALALAWLGRNGDAAMAAIPQEHQEYIPEWARDACTSRERSLLATALEARLAHVEGAMPRYRAALERIDQCIALRNAQQASFNAALAR